MILSSLYITRLKLIIARKMATSMDSVQSIYSRNDLVEDTSSMPSIVGASKSILLQCVRTLMFLPLSLACLPLYIVGLFIWGLPPTISPWSRFYKYFIASFTEGSPEEGIPFTNRILVFIIVFDNLMKSPIRGVGWFLDEMFYPSYRKCQIKDPLFFISAARSGSTQLAGYLEDEEETFIAPMMIEAMFPYIWVWRTIVPILRMIGLKKHFESSSSLLYSEELKKRHNSNLFKTETWEIALGVTHITAVSATLGATFMKWGFLNSALQDQPVDNEFCKLFIEFNDCIMKKVMYHRGLPKQRMFIKGHLLIVARELEQRYDGAKFLAVVRDPIERFGSTVNFIKVVSDYGLLRRYYGFFPVTWRIIRDYVVELQICYCNEEMIFYNQSDKNKLAISFDIYVKDLASSIERIYSFLNIPVSAELSSKAATLQKSSHDRTKRKAAYDPKYNRSLASLGVDEEKLKEYLSNYINWMKTLG